MTTEASPLVGVCDLIRAPEKWENKIVRVRGAMRVTSYGSIGGTSVFLLPLPPELCRYSNSKYANAAEPANITLDLPDYFVRKNPPAGFYIDDLSFEMASAQLKEIHRDNPLARWAAVVVEGIVFVRKYNVVEIQRKAAEKKIRGLTDWTAPVVLIARSYQSVEAPPFRYSQWLTLPKKPGGK
jgi:hypothetical protein